MTRSLAGGIVSGRKERIMDIKIFELEELREDIFCTQFADEYEVHDVKGYNVYLLDLGGHLGYSMIVYGDRRQIKYANDYALHHRKNASREELRKMYLKSAERQLYTEAELAQPLKDYFDFQRRRKYITELMPLRRDFMSMFYYASTEEEKAERLIRRAEHPVNCAAALGYFAAEDAEFAQRITDLHDQLCRQMEDTANNYEYQKSAFYYELGNHEYHINGYQGDWDTLSAFGRITWKGQGREARAEYYKELNFTDIQIKAFEDAIREYMKKADEEDWY